MRKNIYWISGFIALYALHAVFFLSYSGQFPIAIPMKLASGLSILTLIGLVGLVIAFAITRDEVLRRKIMISGAISAISVGVLSYLIAAFGWVIPLIAAPLWAVAIIVFLIIYGVLTWRDQL